MEYFKNYFNEVENWDKEEVIVECPFHQDTNPSASINTDKGLFHCWVCDVGYSEQQFIAKINNLSSAEASRLLSRYKIDNSWETNVGLLWSDKLFIEKVKELGLSESLIDEMSLGLVKDEFTGNKYLGIPVFYNNILVDIRKYNIMKYKNSAKMMSLPDAEIGWIIPYDKFLKSNETCYLFEGEKDMLIARENGVNAYTLGGAMSTPNSKTINAFKDKEIVLCYDNDTAGEKGMYKVYKSIREYVKKIKYIDIGEVVKENKEDFHDFIIKYDGDIFDFYALEEYDFIDKQEEDKKVTIKDALDENQLKKTLSSVVTVTSEFTDTFAVPTVVHFEKFQENEKKNETMMTGEEKDWYLENNNIDKMLELIEVAAKTKEVQSNLRKYVGIPSTEEFVKISIKETKTVYKSTVIDKDFDGSAQSLELYSFEKLNVGGQYKIDYKIIPHPTKHQKIVAIAFKSLTIHDNKNYQLNKQKLNSFKINGSIEDRLDYLYQSAKHHIAKHLNYDLWLMCDLVFNSILDFNYGGEMRGCLDIFILGDTQSGKSETSGALVDLYNFGHFLSLKTSTTVGLIGGSTKIDGSYCNTIGSIPRQHKRLAVLEEFSGAHSSFIKTMTDIRSSNELRLSRASGELVVPCKLRMISISNPVNDDTGNPRFLNTFPNGIIPLMELIKSAEDVARYDGFLLVPKVEKRFNPFAFTLKGEPIPKENYIDKSNWVSTRKSENVLFEDGCESYIWDVSEKLNEKFECNFPLFGTTTSKKLARFCVALASLLVNVDESYENIVVTKEIVDYMASYLEKIYTTKSFRLEEYANEYKSYSECTDQDVKELQKIYSNNSTLLSFISSVTKTNRSNIMSVSGMTNDKFSIIFNKLVANKFIRINMDVVNPTDKFRKAFTKIDKSFTTDCGSLHSTTGNNNITFNNDLGGK